MYRSAANTLCSCASDTASLCEEELPQAALTVAPNSTDGLTAAGGRKMTSLRLHSRTPAAATVKHARDTSAAAFSLTGNCTMWAHAPPSILRHPCAVTSANEAPCYVWPLQLLGLMHRCCRLPSSARCDWNLNMVLTWEGLACSMGADERRCPLLVQARQLQQRQRLVAQAHVHRLRASIPPRCLSLVLTNTCREKPSTAGLLR